MLIKQIPFLKTGDLTFVGPDLDEGALPAVFYFSLSAKDSLTLDPFNQFVSFSSSFPMRIFSMTIPGHEEGLLKEKAIDFWADHFRAGKDLITPFIDTICDTIDQLDEQQLLIKNKIGVAGLSRGGYIALHTAIQSKKVDYILCFAPMIDLAFSKSFHDVETNTLLENLKLEHHLTALIHKKIRIYIGNRDVCVGTEKCTDFVIRLADHAYQHQIRSPQVECILSPSVGKEGHGTLPDIFQQGALWMKKQLL